MMQNLGKGDVYSPGRVIHRITLLQAGGDTPDRARGSINALGP